MVTILSHAHYTVTWPLYCNITTILSCSPSDIVWLAIPRDFLTTTLHMYVLLYYDSVYVSWSSSRQCPCRLLRRSYHFDPVLIIMNNGYGYSKCARLCCTNVDAICIICTIYVSMVFFCLLLSHRLVPYCRSNVSFHPLSLAITWRGRRLMCRRGVVDGLTFQLELPAQKLNTFHRMSVFSLKCWWNNS